jgi:hypothetical protein
MRCAFVCLFLLAICLPRAAFTTVTTQKTEPKPIGETDRTDKAQNRPPAPNVCVQYTLTVDDKTGKVSLKTKFTNKDDNAKSFLLCQMIGITGDQAELPTCKIRVDADAKKIKCEAAEKRKTFMKSYHFGCKKVDLAGKEMKEVDYGSGTSEDFVGKKASDFMVTYADYIKLPAGYTYDETSCAACFGANRNLILGGPMPEIQGDWYLPKMPFKDPFIVFQDMASQAVPAIPEYESLFSPLSSPSNFPANVPQLPHNVPQPVPTSYPLELNLMDIYTMSLDSAQTTPAQITLYTDGALSQFSLYTTPSPGVAFNIPGGDGLMGTITASFFGDPAESSRATITVVVHAPDIGDSLGASYFTQRGTFINDTQPPVGMDPDVMQTPDDSVRASLSAYDATTTPLTASFWYSMDGGVTWQDHELASTSNVFDDLHTRAFIGTIGGIGSASNLQYFFTVQDEVFNMLFYGIGHGVRTSVDDGTPGTRFELSRVFPNPVRAGRSRVMNVLGRFLPDADATFRLYAASGTEVAEWRVRPGAGQRAIALPLGARDLASGLYLLRLEQEDRMATTRVLIVR